MQNQRLGIQFNFDREEPYPHEKVLLAAAGERADWSSENLDIAIGKNGTPLVTNRGKLAEEISRALPYSSYSNAYLYLPASPLVSTRLKSSGTLLINKIADPTDLAANFNVAPPSLLAALRDDVRYAYYNELFHLMYASTLSAGLVMSLSIQLDPKEETGNDHDVLFISCMLDEAEPTE